MFHIIGSTGRTGTNYIAGTLNQLPGVLALHEGYELTDGEPNPILPTINLENFAVYKNPEKADDVITRKRNSHILDEAKLAKGASTLIDIAYYNPTLALEILSAHPSARMIGIIRNCYDFVRSAAFLEGEDILAVGWPDPQKDLSSRESFIAMGRLRPLRGAPEYKSWKDWGTVERNIWLWRETNTLLLDAQKKYPKRVKLLAFEQLKNDPMSFWSDLLTFFGLTTDENAVANLVSSTSNRNKKSTGYQIGDLSEWTSNQKEFLETAQRQIDQKWER